MNSKCLVLRKARPEEADILTSLAFRSKASNGYDDAFMEACRAELTYTARTISAGETWVADRGGAIEGFFDVRFEGAIAEVYAMFVEQDVKRAGTGRVLWRKIEDIAEAVDAAEIGLDADPFAVAFYQAMGCVVDGESPSASVPGRMLPRMVKRLGGP